MKPHSTQSGVSLLEVLIALLVIAFGVLGLTKMQALSIANAQVSGSRGLVALQASSLAALLHSDKRYWQGGAGATLCSTTCTFSGASTSLFGTIPTLATCQGTTSATACTDKQIAALDINTWMTNINTQVPTYSALLTCATTIPTSCTIQINWYEKAAGMNTTTAALATANTSTQQAYYLYVQP